jgi:glucan phosphoethanolaminetransferase (alkaline phosphatase superfamily)
MDSPVSNTISKTSLSSTSGSYIPGVCNINTAEIAYRRKSGHVMLAITVFLTVVLFMLPLNQWLRVVLFTPIFVTAVCYLQAKYKFCVSYGANGMQNATEGDKEAQEIVDAAAKKLDRDRTRKIKLQAAGIAAVVATILIFIPV